MIPVDISGIADLLDEALLLLSPKGVIEVISQQALVTAGLASNADLLGQPLHQFVQCPEETLSPFLRACLRTTEQTIGVVQFRGLDQSHRVNGCRIGGKDGEPVRLLLQLKPQEVAIQQFATLNEKIDQLNFEIARRRMAESRLRSDRDVAEFGRDVSISLVHPDELHSVLRKCTDLMVQRLAAAFARIWLADTKNETLNLVASSGIYTHLDGPHSCIRVGEYKIGRIAQNQVPHVTNAVIGDDEVHDQEWARREGMISFAGYPLIADGVCVGVMAMFSQDQLTTGVTEALSSVANGIALRIRKQKIEDDLAEQTHALLEAGRRKDEFLAMLSHELRNPLAPVRSGLDLLALENSDQQDLIELMQQQMQHLVRLVDDLLDVSRITRDKVELRKGTVEVAVLVRQAVETLRESIDNAQQTLDLKIPEIPIWIDADPVRIKQIFENLLKNACKYSDEGGNISITVSQDRDMVHIEITDDGIGMDGELLPQVFDLFTQSHQALDRSQGGLGIGLTLVKRLVEMHHGQVDARSEGLHRGSTFTVRLPTCGPPTQQVSDAINTDTLAAFDRQRGLRVLAVDDNRGARMVLSRLLEKLGVQHVFTAADGPSALTQIQQCLPHLVILDIGLPGMSGFDVARQIRRSHAGDSILLVALTGYGQQDDRRKSEEAGFDLHLVKPPGIDQLRELLRHPRLVDGQ